MTLILILCIGAAALLLLVAYLKACGDALRWLTPLEWWDQATCDHTRGTLIAIEFDGTSVHECSACGKIIRTPL